MPAEIIFDDSASREYLKSRRWYVSRAGESIAAAFTKEIDRALAHIADAPTAGIEFRIHYRWVRLKKFPYLIYYRVVDADTVLVLVVAHHRRRLGYWARRDR